MRICYNSGYFGYLHYVFSNKSVDNSAHKCASAVSVLVKNNILRASKAKAVLMQKINIRKSYGDPPRSVLMLSHFASV